MLKTMAQKALGIENLYEKQEGLMTWRDGWKNKGGFCIIRKKMSINLKKRGLEVAPLRQQRSSIKRLFTRTKKKK